MQKFNNSDDMEDIRALVEFICSRLFTYRLQTMIRQARLQTGLKLVVLNLFTKSVFTEKHSYTPLRGAVLFCINPYKKFNNFI